MSAHLRNVAVLMALGALLAACGKQGRRGQGRARRRRPWRPDAEKVLNVYNWSDYIDPDLLEAVRDRDRHQGRSTARWTTTSMLDDQAAAPAAPATTWWCPRPRSSRNQIKADIYQKLDKSKLTNYEQPRPGDPEEAGALRSGQ